MEKLKIYAKTVEETALTQIRAMNECEAYRECKVRIMPDCHAGSSCTIGTVIEVKERIVPNTVGVDIGCGMLVAEFEQIELNLQKLDEVVNTLIPSGFNIHETPVTEFEGLSQLRCLRCIDQEKALCAIGTLGGGNHFIEANKDEEENVYIVIHSGSRNLGVKVCGHYQQLAIKERTDISAELRAMIERLKREGRACEISEEIKKVERPNVVQELAWISGETLNDYLHDMAITQQYAQLNRETMPRIICKSMGITPNNVFQTIHNYIDIGETGVILRKGAVSAKKGERLIIPMNMRDGSLICEGKGNADWLYSAPHGAGRLMSRHDANHTITLEEFQTSMKGIYSTSICKETIDESPMAYKPMQGIIECVQPTVEIQKIIKPVYNFKAKG